jgi:primosomal protein N' (replication factor Y) (superfamily II helicase)
MYAEVIIPIPIGTTFTYGVSLELQSQIQIGMRVEVSFGNNKKYAGIVLQIHHNKPDNYVVKPIISLIDLHPILTERHLQLWQWMATYYMCSLGEVMVTVLPAYLKLNSETYLMRNAFVEEAALQLNDNEFLLMEAMDLRNEISISEAGKILDSKLVRATISSLIEKKAIVVFENMKQSYKPKLEKVVLLNESLDNEVSLKELFTALEKAPKQLHLLLSYLHLFNQDNKVMQSNLLDEAGATTAQLKAMVDKQIFRVESMAIDRNIFTPSKTYEDFELNEMQQNAFQFIVDNLKIKEPLLLHGITGSGKTNVHIKIIEKYIEDKKQVLYLLPEIALTTQLINKLYSVFGEAIGIYHSKFSNNQRIETWMNVRSGKVKIIIGARSSLFLPFQDLGLIIVDEEHDSSYKQSDTAPLYNARDTAIVYSKVWNCNIILSSATPSVETYQNAVTKKYKYISISERFAQVPLPQIEIVDNKNPLQLARTSPLISDVLLQAIQSTLQKHKQVILFQNRRGFAPYLYCGACGWNAICNNCDVSLSYHKQTDKLHCHYCGTKWPLFHACPKCKSNKLYFKNYGTERVEDEVKKLFPNANVSRLDLDTARTKNKYQNIIKEVEHNITDILIGTQMVVKGLDFDNVELVGVLHADSLFTIPHFRVNERAFQLLTQVSGRSGRKSNEGKVLIQAFQTQNPYLQLVKENNYKVFFAREIKQRKEFHYPPFVRLIKISIKHKSPIKTQQAVQWLGDQFSQIQDTLCIGPAVPLVGRIMNLYVQEILLKCSLSTTKLTLIKSQIHSILNTFTTGTGNSTVKIVIDVDPS